MYSGKTKRSRGAPAEKPEKAWKKTKMEKTKGKKRKAKQKKKDLEFTASGMSATIKGGTGSEWKPTVFFEQYVDQLFGRTGIIISPEQTVPFPVCGMTREDAWQLTCFIGGRMDEPAQPKMLVV